MPIILYQCDDITSLQNTLKERVNIFEEKHGAYNVARIDIGGGDTRPLESECETSGFFSGEKLILLSGLNLTMDSGEEGEESGKKKAFSEKLLSLLESLSDTITLILIHPHLDSRTKLAKFIEIHAEKYICDDKGDTAVNISPSLRALIDRRTTDTPYARRMALEKVSLYSLSTPPDRDLIDAILPEEKEAVIFTVIDDLLAGRYVQARRSLLQIIYQENIYSVFGSLISNLRTALMILIAQERKTLDIAQTFGIHPFVVKKTRGDEKVRTGLQKFLTIMIEGEIAQKSGKGLSDYELGMIFTIDRGIIALQKMKKNYTEATL